MGSPLNQRFARIYLILTEAEAAQLGVFSWSRPVHDMGPDMALPLSIRAGINPEMLQAMIGGGGGGMMQIELTVEDEEAINRLMALGFPRGAAIQVGSVCAVPRHAL